jgi:uncharacterized protein (TIGR02996 family)
MEEALLQAIHASPADDTARLVLADWLQEQGDPRGELLRLHVALRQRPEGADLCACEERVRALLAAGVRPCVPVLTNSIGMQLALIPPGVFLMGSPAEETGRNDDEGPQHEVAITRPYYLGVFAVTQGQWLRLMGSNPSYFCPRGGGKGKVRGIGDTRDFPVENVSWYDAGAFCRILSELPDERRAQRLYRLPTEAEWEYACRGGPWSSTPFHLGASLSSAQANFNGNAPYGGALPGPHLRRTTEVGAYHVSNAFGLYDLHGNVFEWCADWYSRGHYRNSPRDDPTGPPVGEGRVLRGGSWSRSSQDCRSASRRRDTPGSRNPGLGFRVALVPSLTKGRPEAPPRPPG